MEITFNDLPKAIFQLTNEVSEIKKLLLSKGNESITETPEQLFNVHEAAEFLNLKATTVYSMVSKNELPLMKRSKRLYFSRIELINYLKQGRKITTNEAANEAANYLIKKGF